MKIGINNIVIGQTAIRVQPEGLAVFGERFLISPKCAEQAAQLGWRVPASWIGLCEHFHRPLRLLQIAGDDAIKFRLDGQFSIFARVLTEFEGPAHVVNREVVFLQIRIVPSELGVGQSEIWVEPDGPLEQGQRVGGIASPYVGLPCQAVGLKSVKRRRGGLSERGIEFLHAAERFAQLLAYFRTGLSQGVQYLALIVHLSFGACEQIPV